MNIAVFCGCDAKTAAILADGSRCCFVYEGSLFLLHPNKLRGVVAAAPGFGEDGVEGILGQLRRAGGNIKMQKLRL